MTNAAPLPEITITTMDYDRLCNLAESASRNAPEVSAFLLDELSRAIVTPPSDKPIVRMGSHVDFRDEENETVQSVRLVYPDQSDSRQGLISILTPVGTALIGLSPGQSIQWRDRRGSLKKLTVLAVQDAPEAQRTPAG
ncbi:MAG: nucleoside diphosphate kinase regulator [Pseudomonadota bacterium]